MAKTNPASDPAGELDALGLSTTGLSLGVHFGDIDASGAVRNLKARNAINDLPSAELELDIELLGGRPPDYFATAQITQVGLALKHALFTGSVTTAEPLGPRAALSLGAMPEMQELAMPSFAAWMVSAPEITHAMMRSIGLPDSQLNIQGLDTLQHETFEVIAPVDQLNVSARTRLDNVHILPGEQARRALEKLGPEEQLAVPFAEANCHAVTYVTATRMFDAELEGLRRIDVALSWLAVQARYGLAVWPDGTPRRHRRAWSRAAPARSSMVWVRGLMSTRQWIRTPQPIAPAGLFPIESAGQPGGAGQLRLLSVQERQAALALRRAGSTGEPLQRITALWEAVEFYLAGTAIPDSFTQAQLRALRKGVPSDLPGPLRRRAINALNRLNEPPLMARLRAAGESDGVMLSPAEWEMLSRLRRVRNESVHGAQHTTVGDADLDLGVSILARLLLHRAHRRRIELDRADYGRQ
jgi:hypothetical protein